MFTIGEEQFDTVKELDQALRALGYPQTVWINKEQMGFLVHLMNPDNVRADESGPYVLVGASRVRTYPVPAIDTMDHPKWRKQG